MEDGLKVDATKQDKIREVNGVLVNVDELVRQSFGDENKMIQLLIEAAHISHDEAVWYAGNAFRNRGIDTPVFTTTRTRKTNLKVLSAFFGFVLVVVVLIGLIRNAMVVSANDINSMSSVSDDDIEKYLKGQDIDPVSVTVEYLADGRFVVHPHFVLGAIWDADHGRDSMNIDTLEVFKAFQDINNVSRVSVVWYADIIDAYGNEREDIALAVSMYKSTIDYCNFSNLYSDDLSVVSDEYILIPAFS